MSRPVLHFLEKTIAGQKLVAVALFLQSRNQRSNLIERTMKSIQIFDVSHVNSNKSYARNFGIVLNLVLKEANLSKEDFRGNTALFIESADLDEDKNKKYSKRKVMENEGKNTPFMSMFSAGGNMYKETSKLAFASLLSEIGSTFSLIKLNVDSKSTPDVRLTMLAKMREYAEQFEENKAPEEKRPVFTFDNEKAHSILEQRYNKYSYVIDIHTDGSARIENGIHMSTFGVNILKRDLDQEIYHNFKRICGFEKMKGDSSYAELKAVEVALNEINENHEEFAINDVLLRFYIDNEQVIKAIQSGKLWNTTSQKTIDSYNKIKSYQKKFRVSFVKVNSKENKGNKIAHLLARDAYETCKNEENFIKTINTFSDFEAKLDNNFYREKAKQRYKNLLNELSE